MKSRRKRGQEGWVDDKRFARDVLHALVIMKLI